MKKEEIPQDAGALNSLTKELSYAVDEKGNYTTALSAGWEVKNNALDVAWNDVDKRIADAKQKVLNGEASPLLYYMELKLMDPSIVASYTGFWKWQIKKHLKPSAFNKLNEKRLKKYAEVFEVSLEELKNIR
ncbi:MAG: hypothetical protein QM764_23285 [Chitinophagaceae bacterium]